MVIGGILLVVAVIVFLGSFTTLGWLVATALFSVGVYAMYQQFVKKKEPKNKPGPARRPEKADPINLKVDE